MIYSAGLPSPEEVSVPEFFPHRDQTPEQISVVLVLQDSGSPISGLTTGYRLVCKMEMDCTLTTVFWGEVLFRIVDSVLSG